MHRCLARGQRALGGAAGQLPAARKRGGQSAAGSTAVNTSICGFPGHTRLDNALHAPCRLHDRGQLPHTLTNPPPGARSSERTNQVRPWPRPWLEKPALLRLRHPAVLQGAAGLGGAHGPSMPAHMGTACCATSVESPCAAAVAERPGLFRRRAGETAPRGRQRAWPMAPPRAASAKAGREPYISSWQGDWKCGCGSQNKLWDACVCGQASPCRYDRLIDRAARSWRLDLAISAP